MGQINAVHIHVADTCVTVMALVPAGEEVRYLCGDGATAAITARQDIPLYHKVAITKMPEGAYVIKYGEQIGVAKLEIQAGDHVHIHNVRPLGKLHA